MLTNKKYAQTTKIQKTYQALLAWQQQVGTAKKIDYRQLIEDDRNHSLHYRLQISPIRP